MTPTILSCMRWLYAMKVNGRLLDLTACWVDVPFLVIAAYRRPTGCVLIATAHAISRDMPQEG